MQICFYKLLPYFESIDPLILRWIYIYNIVTSYRISTAYTAIFPNESQYFNVTFFKKSLNVKLLWKRTAIFYVIYTSRVYVIQTIKKNSTADISISFMLFTIYKEIQIGFGKLLNQYKQKTDKIQNMTTFEKISGILEISRKLASLRVTTRSKQQKYIFLKENQCFYSFFAWNFI